MSHGAIYLIWNIFIYHRANFCLLLCRIKSAQNPLASMCSLIVHDSRQSLFVCSLAASISIANFGFSKNNFLWCLERLNRFKSNHLRLTWHEDEADVTVSVMTYDFHHQILSDRIGMFRQVLHLKSKSSNHVWLQQPCLDLSNKASYSPSFFLCQLVACNLHFLIEPRDRQVSLILVQTFLGCWNLLAAIAFATGSVCGQGRDNKLFNPNSLCIESRKPRSSLFLLLPRSIFPHCVILFDRKQ